MNKRELCMYEYDWYDEYDSASYIEVFIDDEKKIYVKGNTVGLEFVLPSLSDFSALLTTMEIVHRRLEKENLL